MSEPTTIKATAKNLNGVKDNNVAAEFAFDYGNAEDLVSNWGAEVVLQFFIAGAKIPAQSALREMLQNGKSPEEAVLYMQENYKPGIDARNPVDTIVSRINASGSDEERNRRIEELQAALDAVRNQR